MKKLVSFLLAISMSVVLFACGGAPAKETAPSNAPSPTKEAAQPKTDKIIMKVTTGTATDHPENVGARYFEKLVEEKSNGRVDVQVYDQGRLGSQKDFVEGLRMGTLEITMVTPGFLSTYEPVLNVYELPYLYKSPAQAYKVLEGPLNGKIKASIEKHDLKILAFWEAGTRHITNSKKPIKTPDDLKGLKIRVPQSQVNIDTFTTFGANAAPLAFTELYMALQQKVFDGQENPLSNIYGSKFYEAQKYLSLSGHQFLPHVFMYSKKLWDKLPKDIQDIVLASAQEAAVYQRKVVQDEDAKLIDELKKKGMEVNEVDQEAFRKAAKPLFDKYIQQYGQEAKEIIDTIQATN